MGMWHQEVTWLHGGWETSWVISNPQLPAAINWLWLRVSRASLEHDQLQGHSTLFERPDGAFCLERGHGRLSCLFFFKIFIFLGCAGSLDAAHGIFSYGVGTLSCGMWDLDPWPRVEPGIPALGAQSLSHWTTGKSWDSASWLSCFLSSSRTQKNWCRKPQRRQETENQA